MPDRLKQIARASVENGGRRQPRNEMRNANAGMDVTFSRITRFLARISTKHIYKKDSLDS